MTVRMHTHTHMHIIHMHTHTHTGGRSHSCCGWGDGRHSTWFRAECAQDESEACQWSQVSWRALQLPAGRVQRHLPNTLHVFILWMQL